LRCTIKSFFKKFGQRNSALYRNSHRSDKRGNRTNECGGIIHDRYFYQLNRTLPITFPPPRHRMLQRRVGDCQIKLASAFSPVVFPPRHFTGIGVQVRASPEAMRSLATAVQASLKNHNGKTVKPVGESFPSRRQITG
jgi:hypothetical protein